MKEFDTGLTYDDVLLIPGYSEVLPREVNVTSRITRDIKINIPIVSSAMDTVTEAKLAIALAQEGGIGIIHRNLSIDEQVKEVEKVKKYESGIIRKPITLKPDATAREAIRLMNNYNISGIPVVDDNGILMGIVTHRDLRFVPDKSVKLNDIMTPKEKLITAGPEISFTKAREILHKNRIEKLPLIDKDNKLVGLMTYKDIEKQEKFPNACKDNQGRLRVAGAVGVGKDGIERAEALVSVDCDIVVVDSAHGHSKAVIETTKEITRKFPDLPVISGNIVTEEGALELIKAGATGIKVGVGPGAICTTRVIAGVGVPQFSAILSCSKAVEKYNIPILADGGIRYSGDITKALAGGASCVVIGSLLAGTEESPGERILLEGRSYKIYRGMGSLGAMVKGSSERYFQSEQKAEKLVPEGIEGRVPYKGFLSDLIFQLVGGLKAGMGYIGAKNIKELQQKAKFVRITTAGLYESHPHDITITREAPNYEFRR